MRKHIIYLIFLIQLSNNLNAQTIKLGFETGIGNYQMTYLKSVINSAVENNTLQPKIVTNFPAYLYYQPSISFCKETHNWGFNFTLLSTGARASIRDYSGEYRFDNTVVGYAPGFFEEFRIFRIKDLSLFLRADAGILSSSIQFKEYFKVNSQTYIDDSWKVICYGLFTKPSIKATYSLSNKLNFEADLGYHFDLYNGSFHSETDPITYFRHAFFQSGNKLSWNGFRFGLACTYSFSSNPH